MIKILTVVGARPQFIKAAVLSRLWQSDVDIQEVLVHTGQHYDRQMSEVFFRELEIPEPKYNLGVGSGSHGEQTGRMLIEVERVVESEKPDLVLVYGDTNSTLAGALSAAKLHIALAHVEAGLRSLNKKMPEEINRVLTDHCADLLFAPTDQAVANLIKEGISPDKIHLVGDIMYDSALYFAGLCQIDMLESLHLSSKNYILVTIHRAENTDTPQHLRAIFEQLIEVSHNIKVVLPLHPRTRKALEKESLLGQIENHLQVIPPCSYLEMASLEKNARLIVTDSGGVQKEAYFYQVPCLTLRRETEWVETVQAGGNQLLAPSRFAEIAETVSNLLRQTSHQEFMPLYGDGDTAQKINHIIKSKIFSTW